MGSPVCRWRNATIVGGVRATVMVGGVRAAARVPSRVSVGCQGPLAGRCGPHCTVPVAFAGRGPYAGRVQVSVR
ncbi:hypothetical protein QQY66_12465 [Streptomyces sp. DG2A-72]|uniref:hypothetical protein n=1 Tax=Streptomyces sp. DG2A-72 TaxID=3051386 RepID=UPI00265BF9EF|nr:hypothetical protein [Streptomyces sp. DG2A-72]MDO0932468.1 hypothetical protein [Streptomyces sp. DG2A-72]